MNALALTLSTRHLPAVKPLVRDIVLVVLGSLLVAACAQISIPLPFTPVPITGQTFAVLLVAAALGSKRGAASLALYALESAVGLPFLAGGATLVNRETGMLVGSAGYVFGFILAAWVIGLLAERGLDRSFRTSLLPFLVGTLIVYVCGAIGLMALFKWGVEEAITKGILPFLIGDAIKLLLAGLLLPATWKLVKE